MIDFLEICERALTGPLMTEADFDMKVFTPKLGQVAHGAVNMSQPRANQIVNTLFEKDEGDIEKTPRGKRYQECFVMKTRKPTPDYVASVEEVKEELRGMGVV